MKKILFFLAPRLTGMVFIIGVFMLLGMMLKEMVLQPEPFNTRLFIVFVLGCMCLGSLLVAMFFMAHEIATENYKRMLK
jgi:tellurite resistance protein TehA-like permease